MINLDVLAIITIQSIVGTDPDKTPGILENALNIIRRKAVGRGYSLKKKVIILLGPGCSGQKKEYNCQDDIPP